MTESTTPPVHENDNETPPSSSPWVMLISMLLLIAGLTLSSAMLVHYALDGKEGVDSASSFDLTQLLDKGKTAWTARPKSRSVDESRTLEANDSPDSTAARLLSGGDEGSVRWPKLKLTGFGKSVDEEGSFAIINGQQVLVNTFIGDVRLVEIRSHGAVVEYKGERKILTVDQIH